MARPSLLPFRRKKEEALVASGLRVDFKDTTIIEAILKRQAEWQRKAYDAEEACGELANGVLALCDLVSSIQVFGAEQPSERDAEPTRTTNQQVIDTVDRLGSTIDVSDFLWSYARQQVLVGACHLVGIQPGEGRDNQVEKWAVYGIEEVEKGSFTTPSGEIRETLIIKDYDGSGKNLQLNTDGDDTWIYLWRGSARKKSAAWSPVKPLLSSIEELLWWDAAAAAVAKNRLATAGAVGVPSNLEVPAENEADRALSGSQRFIKKLYDTAIRAITNPGSASAAVPIFYTYPFNDRGKSGLDVTEFERKQDELLEKRTDRALRRIAQGFPLPVENFFGISETTRWGGRTVEESKFRENVAPFVRFLMHGLTVAWLRPILRELGVEDPEKYMFWYDASALIVHPDMGQAADKGVEYGAISLKAWRRTRNFAESDAPTDAEREEQLKYLLALRGRERVQPEDTPPSTDPDDTPDDTEPGQRAPKPMPAAPARGKGQPIAASTSSNGHVTTSMAEHVRISSMLQVMADEKIRRALEHAGNKLRSRANKNKSYAAAIKGADSTLIASILGREAVIKLDIDTLFDGSFTDVPSRIQAICYDSFHPDTDYTQLTSTLLSSMRELASRYLFEPPGADLLVPIDAIDTALRKVAVVGSPA